MVSEKKAGRKMLRIGDPYSEGGKKCWSQSVCCEVELSLFRCDTSLCSAVELCVCCLCSGVKQNSTREGVCHTLCLADDDTSSLVRKGGFGLAGCALADW